MLDSQHSPMSQVKVSHVVVYGTTRQCWRVHVQLPGEFGVDSLNVRVVQDKRPRADGTVPSFRSDRKTTVGVEFATMVVTHPDGKRIKAQIWDTGES